MIRVPALTVFVPPAMTMCPAAPAGFGEFVAPVVGRLAEIAVIFDGFVEVVIGLRNVSAAVVTIGAELRSADEQQKTPEEHRHEQSTPMEWIVQAMLHGCLLLSTDRTEPRCERNPPAALQLQLRRRFRERRVQIMSRLRSLNRRLPNNFGGADLPAVECTIGAVIRPQGRASQRNPGEHATRS